MSSGTSACAPWYIGQLVALDHSQAAGWYRQRVNTDGDWWTQEFSARRDISGTTRVDTSTTSHLARDSIILAGVL